MNQELLNIDDKIDRIENSIINELEPIECPLVHTFLPGMYIREVFMKKDLIVTSKVHDTVHPFVVLKGAVSVFSENDGEQLIEAPYFGITRPGTRRVLFIHSDCVWQTFHPLPIITGEENELCDEEKAKFVDKIESIIMKPYTNNLLNKKEDVCLGSQQPD